MRLLFLYPDDQKERGLQKLLHLKKVLASSEPENVGERASGSILFQSSHQGHRLCFSPKGHSDWALFQSNPSHGLHFPLDPSKTPTSSSGSLCKSSLLCVLLHITKHSRKGTYFWANRQSVAWKGAERKMMFWVWGGCQFR